MRTLFVFCQIHIRCVIFLIVAIAAHFSTAEAAADRQGPIYHYHEAVPADVWTQITPYILPADHPIKTKLDKIFKKRAIADLDAFKDAGFKVLTKQRWTRMYVATHSKTKGYIFKLYLDKQHYHRGMPEYYFWIRRCIGARVIQDELNINGWNHLFKVPKKYIYPLPPTPAPLNKGPAKHFILVEEDMDIFPPDRNHRLWGSKLVSKEILDALYYIIQKHGFWDCAKPDNIPISKDNRIAFVDTQTFHRWPVAFEKLTQFLSDDLAVYWQKKYTESH